MGCSGCSNGRGCATIPNGCRNNGSCGTGGCNKLDVFDWLTGLELPSGVKKCEYVEVRFKNSRKEFYRFSSDLELLAGELVAVEAASGHDIGIVSLSGELVKVQMKRKKASTKEIRKIYRKAKQTDVDKWQEAHGLEKETMFKARTLASELNLAMKISDVEYQGDKSKATFYYTAEERVDFRELIKVMAENFKIRIEMRQIGARQEAGRIGGIGSCGRELCCSTWLTDFRSVSTNVARYQQLSLNPLKLAGQCGKLKCCLNFELDMYVEALEEFPKTNVVLETKKGRARHFKTDIFKRIMWYSYIDEPGTIVAMELDYIKEIIEMNIVGDKPDSLKDFAFREPIVVVEDDYENVVGQDSLTRFDRNKSKNKKKKRKQQSGGKPHHGKSNPNAKHDQKGQQNKRRNHGKPQHKKKNNPGKKDN